MGRIVLEKEGYYSENDPVRKRRKFLKFHTLRPMPRKDGIHRAICMDFDMEKQEFRFDLDKELNDENRDYFFAFKLGAPKDRKKFLATNNFESFLTLTFNDTLAYLEEKRKLKNSWCAENISEDYDQLLKELLDRFYLNENGSCRLDEKCMAPDQYEKFCKVRTQLMEKQKDREKPVPDDKLYRAFLLEKYREDGKKALPTIFLVKINGRHILEHPNPEVARAYVNLVYYDLYQRFLSEDIVKGKHCHVCGQQKDVMGKLPLPMKFYGTTNPLYFENIYKANAYKSFAACDDCMQDILTGMKFTGSHLNRLVFGMTCYLLPQLTGEDQAFQQKLDKAVSMLQKRCVPYKEDIRFLEQLLKQSEKKRLHSFAFNLLFYFAEQQSFNILRYISGIQLRDLLNKMQLMDEFTDMYDLHLIGEYGNSLTIADLRNHLFHSKYSHPNPDFKIYGKGLLDLLDNFLSNRKIGYNDIISRFTDIYRRRFHRKKNDRLAPFKLVGFLTLLHQLNLIKEDNGMTEGNWISEIMKKEYRDFFTTHAAVYGDNAYRQGLFLLGAVISRIAYKQRGKGEGRKDSSTFLAKINFDGIPARRVDKLVNEVRKFAVIYNIFQEPGVWGNITDRLQGIESSSLKPDEVVFYVLTGISFEDYLGMKYALDKKLNTDNNKGDE